ncbi:MAG TPA: metallophosphoesterase, partial [Candidatus Omnitrophota bacterium]|nr:metallophosphoesterase [Candidatus Omnitrophota bacterium]
SGAPGREGLSTVEDIPSTDAPVSSAVMRDGGLTTDAVREAVARFQVLDWAGMKRGGYSYSLSIPEAGRPYFRYLPTDRITPDILGYSDGLRGETPLGKIPGSIEEFKEVNVVFPEPAVFLVSRKSGGSNGMVMLGFLEDGRPVAAKTYAFKGEKHHPGLKRAMDKKGWILQDFRGGYIADKLGIGPAIHGRFIDREQNIYLVMDIVPGDFMGAARESITRETLQDYIEIKERLDRADIAVSDDFQFYVTPDGSIQVIDPCALAIRAEPKNGHHDGYWYNLAGLLDLADARPEKEVLEYLAAHKRDYLIAFGDYLNRTSPNYFAEVNALVQRVLDKTGPDHGIGVKRDGGELDKAVAALHVEVTRTVQEENPAVSEPIAYVDFWADDYVERVVAAIRNRQAIRLDLSSNENREFVSDKDIAYEFFEFANRIASAFNDTDIIVPLKELMKNAFCHGHAKDFDIPIYIILNLDESGTMEKLRVFNIVATKAEGSVPGDGVQKAGDSSLSGNGAALTILKKDWDYSREYVAGGVGCRASITRKAVIEAGLTMWDKRTAFAKLEALNAAIRRGKYQHGMIVEVPPEVEVILVGDLHAKLDNLKKILNTDDNYQKISRGQAVLVLLGDMVHGEEDLFEMDSSILTMQFIMELKIRNPDSVYMLMGNHDYLSDMVAKSGVRQGAVYKEALIKKYGEDYVRQYQSMFLSPSPLMVSGGGFLGVHAGPIMSTTVEELRATRDTHELSDMAQEATQGMWGSTYDRSYVQEYLAHHGQPDGILLIGHMPVDADDWHWPQWDGDLHIIYGAHKRVGYAYASGGSVSYKEATDVSADFAWDRSSVHDGGAPALQIMAMFGLSGITRTPGVTMSEPREYDGYYVRRATFAQDAALSDQLKLLKHELYAIEAVPFDRAASCANVARR